MIKMARVFVGSLLAVLSVAVLSVAAVPVAGAAGGAARSATGGGGAAAFAVAGSSLAQDGPDLVWHVALAHSFSPGGLIRDHRALCLLLERARNGSVAGQVCVAGPAVRRGPPTLVYAPITRAGPGARHVLAATIARASDRELTASFAAGDVSVSYAPLRWQVVSSVRAPACTPATAAQPECSTLYPAAPALLVLRVPHLVGCAATGPPFVYHGPAAGREVALTFDDGPWYDTPAFLSLLEREHVNATFFEIGRQVGPLGEGGAIERRMLADGDMLGDHTWSHPDVAAGGAFAASQISEAALAIRRATGGFQPCLFRAPYGAVSGALIAVARRLGFTTIQWNVDPRDWARPGVSAIVGNVVANVRPGSIVIQHDGGGDRSQTLAALPLEISALRRAGYQFVTVTQMLGYRLLYKY